MCRRLCIFSTSREGGREGERERGRERGREGGRETPATVQKYPSSEDDDSMRFERYFKTANAFARVVLDRLDAADDNGVDEDGADENSAKENWGDIFNLSPILDLEAPRQGLSGLSMPPLGTDIMELAARAEDTGDGWDLWDFRTQVEQAEEEAIVAVGAEAEPVTVSDVANEISNSGHLQSYIVSRVRRFVFPVCVQRAHV